MKIPAIILMILISAPVYSQARIPNDWDTNMPQDTEQFIFSLGVDEQDTERDARLKAEEMATVGLSQKIYTVVDSIFLSIIEKNELGIRERAVEQNYIYTRLVLSNIGKAYKTKQTSGKYKVYCLAYMTSNDVAKAKISAENELACLYAYNFFTQKVPGIKPRTIADSFDGFDYHAWVTANCGIISINGADHLNQLDALVRQLVPGVISFSGIYNGKSAKFIYGAEKLDIISRVLQRHGISFLYSHPTLTVNGSQKLGDLTRMDPALVYVAGMEKVHYSYDAQKIDERGILARELIRIQNANGKNAALFALPARISGSFETEIIKFIQGRSDLPCRYVIFYFAETIVERERTEFRMPPCLFINCRIFVYDQITGGIVLNETIKNGIPISGASDLLRSYELLTSRLLNTAFVEALSNSMEVKNAY